MYKKRTKRSILYMLKRVWLLGKMGVVMYSWGGLTWSSFRKEGMSWVSGPSFVRGS